MVSHAQLNCLMQSKVQRPSKPCQQRCHLDGNDLSNTCRFLQLQDLLLSALISARQDLELTDKGVGS